MKSILSIIVLACLGLNTFLGKYVIKSRTTTTTFEFKANNEFIEETIIHFCGMGIVQNGIFSIKSDTLILEYNHYYDGYEKDVNDQYVSVLKEMKTENDSIDLKITFVESNKQFSINPQIYDDVLVKINEFNHKKKTFEDTLNIRLKRSETYKISAKVNSSVPVEFQINGTQNYSIEFGLNPGLHDVSIPDIQKYLIKKQNENYLILKTINSESRSRRLKLIKK